MKPASQILIRFGRYNPHQETQFAHAFFATLHSECFHMVQRDFMDTVTMFPYVGGTGDEINGF
jgi:hypothetical protein